MGDWLSRRTRGNGALALQKSRYDEDVGIASKREKKTKKMPALCVMWDSLFESGHQRCKAHRASQGQWHLHAN